MAMIVLKLIFSNQNGPLTLQPEAESSTNISAGASQTSCSNVRCSVVIIVYTNRLISIFTFVIDWDNPSIKCDEKGGLSVSKGDFAIRLEMLIEAKAKTGCLATVKRAIDHKEWLV